MDDMTAFERQLSGELGELMGPVRPVDDRAVFDTVAEASRPHTWGFTMFSALKLAAAAAIVALFGGLLLAGVPTMRPNDDPYLAPAVSASPSIESPSEPEASTLRLHSTPEAPGVRHVWNDGFHELNEGDISDVAVTPDGEIWVLRAKALFDDESVLRLIRLGHPGMVLEERLWTPDGETDEDVPEDAEWHRPAEDWTLGVSDDGSLLLNEGPDSTARKLVGDAWEDVEFPACSALTADGDCWLSSPMFGIVRIDEDGRHDELALEDVGLSPFVALTRFTVADDGRLWTAASAPEMWAFDRLVSYDGDTWQEIPYEAPAGLTGPAGWPELSVGPDGTIWAVFEDAETSGAYWVAAWDGEGWATYGPVSTMHGAGTHFFADGRIWFLGGGLELEGEDLHRLDVPSSYRTVLAPDGKAWLVDHEGLLFLIDPDAVVTGELGGGQYPGNDE